MSPKTGSPKRGRGKKDSVEAVRIGEIIPQIFARYGIHRQLDHDSLIQAWSEAVAPHLPDSLRGISLPGSIKRGTLEVQVQHAAIIQELIFHTNEILTTLREKLPECKIRKIRFLVDG